MEVVEGRPWEGRHMLVRRRRVGEGRWVVGREREVDISKKSYGDGCFKSLNSELQNQLQNAAIAKR